MTVVADGMNMLLGTEASTYLCPTCGRTCLSCIGLYICTGTNNPTSKDKMVDGIRRFDVHRRERERGF